MLRACLRGLIAIFVAFALCLSAAGFGFAPVAYAADTATDAGSTEQFQIALSASTPDENVEIQADNMMPGDTETATFHIKANYDNAATISVQFAVMHADDALSGALHATLVRARTGEVLFDGTAAELAGERIHSLPAENTAQAQAQSSSAATKFEADEYYTLALSLPTTATNDVADKDFAAIVRWQIARDDANATGGATTAADDASGASAKTPTTIQSTLAQMGDTAWVSLLLLIVIASVAVIAAIKLRASRSAAAAGAAAAATTGAAGKNVISGAAGYAPDQKGRRRAFFPLT